MLVAVEPTNEKEILVGYHAFNLRMFMVETFKADGSRDKLKDD